MLVSTNTGPYRKLKNLNKILDIIKNAGFDAYDYSMYDMGEYNKYVNLAYDDDYVNKAKKLREYADSINLKCNQAHSIFPSFFLNNESLTNEKINITIRCMEIASILGAKIIVVHPENNATAEQNYIFYKQLEPYCEKFNIKVAVENMWNWKSGESRCCKAACSHPDDFLKHITLLNSKWFTCCVDIGHGEMMVDTSSSELIETLGSHVGALHVHDNDCVHDHHSLPGSGNIDFKRVLDSLKKVNYSGDVTLEIKALFFEFPEKYYDVAAKISCDIAKEIRDYLLK